MREVNYDKFTLTEGDVDKIMKATSSKKTKLKHLSMRNCDLTDSSAAKIAAGFSGMKTVVSIDIRGNRNVREAGEKLLGTALLDLQPSTQLQHVQCDTVYIDPNRYTKLKLIDSAINLEVANTAICCCDTVGGLFTHSKRKPQNMIPHCF